MKKGLLTGIVVLWVGSVIVVAIQGDPGWFLPTLLVGIVLGAWIYFVRMVWKKGTSLFHEEMKPELAEMRLKGLKASLVVTGTSLAVIFVGFAVVSVLIRDVFFLPAFFGIVAFITATIGSLVTFLKGRRKPS